MAVDKNLKRKKKRDEKRKAKRQELEREILREKADFYDWEARHAFRQRDYHQALSHALKKLKLTPADTSMRSLALRCTSELNDMPNHLLLLEQAFRHRELRSREVYLSFGKFALSRGKRSLAQEVFRALESDLASETPQIPGRFGKSKVKELQQYLLYCEAPKVGDQRGLLTRSQSTPGGPSGQGPVTRAAAAPSVDPEAVQPPPKAPSPVEERQRIKVVFEADPEPLLQAIRSHRKSDPVTLDLALKAYRLSFRTSYDQLLCLATLRDVRSLWYQEETARKVMKTLRGRAILADEVGLGKTVEAGIILKEYLMRGLIQTVLVLTPSSLVHQWQEELAGKFGVPFVSTSDPLFKQDPERFWQEPLILASIHTARSRHHFGAVTSRSYDLVIVDEAHHLKNRTTLNWKLVNAIQKTFLLMLTATPVQNNLEELFNLVTLLKPGHLKTQKAFKDQFVSRGSPTDPRNREVLRELLKEVMVRNTRSVTQLQLPPRFALTVRIDPSPEETAFYDAVSALVMDLDSSPASPVPKLTRKRLLEAAGSSHAAALRMLERLRAANPNGVGRRIGEISDLGLRIRVSAKMRKVVELLKASRDQKLLFVNHVATLEELHRVLTEHGVPHALYHGAMSAAQKQESIESFRNGRSVLLATGTGGEGHNLQFCHVLLNFDLPWNPMQIEQRIGRIHRIGQESEVQVFNFCAAGSVEDRILDILDRKINLFELVVGEIDMILGRLQGEEEFSDLVYDIWVKHAEDGDRNRAFDALASKLKRARSAYEKSKAFDEALFQEDFGV